MTDYDIFGDSFDEYASPEQREEMRELGIDPDKHRKVDPVIWMDMREMYMWGSEK